MPKTVWIGGVPTMRGPKDYYPPVYEKISIGGKYKEVEATRLLALRNLHPLERDLLMRVKVTANFVARKLVAVLETHKLTTLELAQRHATDRYEVARRLESVRCLASRYRQLAGSLEPTQAEGTCLLCEVTHEIGYISTYGEACESFICKPCKEEIDYFTV